nr:hypothetical protein [Tanacetum cinerariifolium]
MTKTMTESIMGEFMNKPRAQYYLESSSMTTDGIARYKLKGEFLKDLQRNAFSGTNRKDVVEHIDYFLKIVDPIDFPNNDLRVVEGRKKSTISRLLLDVSSPSRDYDELGLVEFMVECYEEDEDDDRNEEDELFNSVGKDQSGKA